MKVILDTHILLWVLMDDKRLPDKAKEIFNDRYNDIYCSIVSLWEIEIKHSTHPDKMAFGAKEIEQFCKESDVFILPLKKEHIYSLKDLRRTEDAPDHKDPFDRMLICQSKSENAIFLTHDSLLGYYNEKNIITV